MTKKNKGKSNNKNELLDDNIRLIKSKSDWKQFVEMTRENFPKFYEKAIEEGLKYHQENNRFLFGLFKNCELLGTIGFQIIDTEKRGILGYLQVKNEYRRKGIAHKLFTKTLKILREKGCEYCFLAVEPENISVIKIYKQWGFIQIPMIYNVNLDRNNLEITIKKPISKKIIIQKEKEVEDLIEVMFNEYSLVNKAYHYFDTIRYHSMKKNVYTRKIKRQIYMTVITSHYKEMILYLILLLEQKTQLLNVVKEELLEIKNSQKTKEIRITIFGKLKQEEINELEKEGVKFASPFELEGYLLKIKRNTRKKSKSK